MDLLKSIRPGPDTRNQGPSMVLLHAFPCDADLWQDVIPAMQDCIDVIALQLPGVAGQALDPDRPPTIASVAEQVRRTLTDLGVGEAVLVGSSMGGYVALEAWRSWPHRIAGLVLAGSRADADDEGARQRRQGVIERIRNEGTDFLLDTLPQTLLSARSRATKPGVVERLRTMIARVPAESIIATHLMLAKRPDSTPTLKTIRVPTLVVVGEEDTVSPPSHAEAMVREIAGARLAMIPGAGHLLPLEVPDAFCRILDSFLEDMGAGRSPRTRVPPLS